MSKNLHTSTPETETTDMQIGTSGLAPDAMARRRMLLKSLGKGSSVIAAAAIPMHTLATTRSLSLTSTDGKRCTISGTMSGVHSKETITAVCGGLSPGYYHKIEHWPNYISSTGIATNYTGSKTFTQNSTFTGVFGGSSSIGNMTLIAIMNNKQSSDEFHWIAALLNSLSASKAVNYPYSPTEVIGFFNSSSGTIYTNALNFFKIYMEKI